jgi:hypothetical protein
MSMVVALHQMFQEMENTNEKLEQEWRHALKNYQ